MRKQWKQNSKAYRQCKNEPTISEMPNVISVEATEVLEEITNLTEDPIGLYTKQDIEKAKRKIRYKELKKRISLTKEKITEN